MDLHDIQGYQRGYQDFIGYKFLYALKPYAKPYARKWPFRGLRTVTQHTVTYWLHPERIK